MKYILSGFWPWLGAWVLLVTLLIGLMVIAAVWRHPDDCPGPVIEISHNRVHLWRGRP